MTENAAGDAKPKKERSPNFPFIPLKKAVERAEALVTNHKREAARLIAIAPSWGYGVKSSGLLQTVAALKQYGLVEDLGSGDDRKVQVTDLARKIIVDQRPGAQEQGIKEAAKNPKLFGEYIDKWVPDRPSDAHCISELELDRGFSGDAARSFLRIFDETVAFAKLDEEALNSPESIAEILSEPASETGDPEVDGFSFDMERSPVPAPRGPRPFAERLRVALDGRTLAVTATLQDEAEVDQLIAILSANKALLPKAAPAAASVSGPGAVNLD
jgi:hypothetical protein